MPKIGDDHGDIFFGFQNSMILFDVFSKHIEKLGVIGNVGQIGFVIAIMSCQTFGDPFDFGFVVFLVENSPVGRTRYDEVDEIRIELCQTRQ